MEAEIDIYYVMKLGTKISFLLFLKLHQYTMTGFDFDSDYYRLYRQDLLNETKVTAFCTCK